MRTVICAVLAIGLAASPVIAADTNGVLTPGKPAGVKQADLGSPALLAAGGMLALVGVMVGVLSGSTHNGVPAIAPITTTTTATTTG